MRKVKSSKNQGITYIIKQNKRCLLWEVWESYDKGRTGSLMPRIDTKTDESCYHNSEELAVAWCNNR